MKVANQIKRSLQMAYACMGHVPLLDVGTCEVDETPEQSVKECIHIMRPCLCSSTILFFIDFFPPTKQLLSEDEACR